MSWLHRDDGYQLFCNRDEKLSRTRAFWPRIQACEDVRFVAPADGDFGGTWIGTNEFGVSFCLLNGSAPSADQPERKYRSRGLLIPDLLSAASIGEARSRVLRMDLSPYAPFTLAVLEPGQTTVVIEWDGQQAAVPFGGEQLMPLLSSSFDPAGVTARRREEFQLRLEAAGKLDSRVLLEFHQSHGPRPSAYSTCMHRPDAQTVSFSWVTVTASDVRFRYTPDAPCRGSHALSQTLGLRR